MINTVCIVLVEDSFSHEFIIDTVFHKKKAAEDYIIKQCAKTGKNEDNYKIEEQVVY